MNNNKRRQDLIDWTLKSAPMLIAIGVGILMIGELSEPLPIRITASATVFVGIALGFITGIDFKNKTGSN